MQPLNFSRVIEYNMFFHLISGEQKWVGDEQCYLVAQRYLLSYVVHWV